MLLEKGDYYAKAYSPHQTARAMPSISLVHHLCMQAAGAHRCHKIAIGLYIGKNQMLH
jgi:hypothetical protein